MNTRRWLAAVSFLAISTTPALAQTSPEDAPAPGDIVVTATRGETVLSKTPVAMTAISGDDLRAAGITNPTTLADQVPNLDISRSNGLQITIRGVTSTDGTEKGDPSAAFLLDGIYIARPQVQEVSFLDVQRVEVLRGPQGTLYGRNTTAGLVNVIANKPDYDAFGGSLDLGYGNFNAYNGTAVLNMPVSGNFALRAAVNYDQRDSFLIEGTGVTRSFDPFKKNVSARLSAGMRWDTGELVVRGDYSHFGGITFNTPSVTNMFSFPSGAGANAVTPLFSAANLTSAQRRTVNTPLTAALDRDNNTWGVMADLQQELGGITVNYLGSYREFARHENNVSVRGLGAATVPTRFDGDYWQQSHELRFSTNGDGPLKAQAGAYYFQEQSGIYFYLFGLLSPTPNTVGYVFGFPQNPTKAKSYAGFAQATYSLTDTFRLTAGVRYSHDDKSRVGFTVTCATTACNGQTSTGAAIAGETKQTNNAARSFSRTTWRAGFDFDLDDRTLLYGTVSTGYKAGGFNDGCQVSVTAGCNVDRTAAALYYDPETLTSYEAGIKTRLLDNAVRLNLSVFHYDYKSLQLSQIIVCTPGGGLCQNTTNAGVAKVDGVEFETTIRPSENDRFEFNVNYLHARYSQFRPANAGIPTGIDFAGLQLDRSPTWTATAGYTHTIQLGNGGNIEANIHTRISDDYRLAALAQLVEFRQPGYSRTDVSLTYNGPDQRYYLQVFGKNLEDNVVVTTAAAGANGTLQLGDPRTYGVRAGFKF
jgi:iron complex outermembrane recepter protein